METHIFLFLILNILCPRVLPVEVLLLLIIQISSALANSFFCELVPPLFVIRFLRIQLGLYINHILLTLMV